MRAFLVAVRAELFIGWIVFLMPSLKALKAVKVKGS